MRPEGSVTDMTARWRWLVVRGVPADACVTCDEYWFDEDTGFALSRILEENEPAAGRVVTVDWVEVPAA